MVWKSAKGQIQYLVGLAGYRLVPRNRDATSLRQWLYRQPIHTVIDVGASRGGTSQDWLTNYPDAIVHAIEPLPGSFAELESAAAQSGGRLRAYNYAIGRKTGTTTFYVHALHDTSSSLLARTELSAQLLPGTREEQPIQVKLTTLDDLFGKEASSMQPDILVKLDVQGVETDVLAGAMKFLRNVKYLLTEVTLVPVYNGQSTFGEVHAALTDAGFTMKGFVEQYHIENLAPIYADVVYVNEAI